MSIRNDRTGRHEDDLHDELMREGSVSIQTLIDHLNETVVEVPSAFSANVRTPVKMATLALERLIHAGILDKDAPLSL